MNDITLDQTFTAPGPGEYARVAGALVAVQASGTSANLQGSNFPGDPASWQDLGTCTGFIPLIVSVPYAYIRVVAGAAGRVVVSGAIGGGGTGSSGGGGGGGTVTTTDRETVQTTYLVKTAFSGASVGQTVTSVQIIDVTGTPTTVAVLWRNQSTGVDLASAPSAANLEIVGSTALTDAQLRAAPVNVKVSPGTLANLSGTITAGGTAQQLAPANSARRGLSVLNLSSNFLWINMLGTASAAPPSIKLAPETYFETPDGFGVTGAVSIFGATTGQAFTALEY